MAILTKKKNSSGSKTKSVFKSKKNGSRTKYKAKSNFRSKRERINKTRKMRGGMGEVPKGYDNGSSSIKGMEKGAPGMGVDVKAPKKGWRNKFSLSNNSPFRPKNWFKRKNSRTVIISPEVDPFASKITVNPLRDARDITFKRPPMALPNKVNLSMVTRLPVSEQGLVVIPPPLTARVERGKLPPIPVVSQSTAQNFESQLGNSSSGKIVYVPGPMSEGVYETRQTTQRVPQDPIYSFPNKIRKSSEFAPLIHKSRKNTYGRNGTAETDDTAARTLNEIKYNFSPGSTITTAQGSGATAEAKLEAQLGSLGPLKYNNLSESNITSLFKKYPNLALKTLKNSKKIKYLENRNDSAIFENANLGETVYSVPYEVPELLPRLGPRSRRGPLNPNYLPKPNDLYSLQDESLEL